MEPEEVLSGQLEVLEQAFEPPKQKTVICIHLPVKEALVMLERLEGLVSKELGNDANVEFVITREEDRLSREAVITSGLGTFGHFPRVRKLAFEDDTRMLTLAVAQSLQHLPVLDVKIEPYLAVKEGKKNWQINRTDLRARKGALRQPVRGKPGNRSKRG